MSKWPLNERSPTDNVKARSRGYLPHKHCLLPYVVFSNQLHVLAMFLFLSYDC